MNAGRRIVGNVDIDKHRLHALVRHSVVGGGKVENAVKRDERIGIPGAIQAGVLVIGHHPLTVELHGAGFLEDGWQLAFGKERLLHGDGNVLDWAFALHGHLERHEFVLRPRQLDVAGPNGTVFKQHAGLRVHFVQLGKGPDLEPACGGFSMVPGFFACHRQCGPSACECPQAAERAHWARPAGGAQATRGEVVELARLQVFDHRVHFIMERVGNGHWLGFGCQRIKHPARHRRSSFELL